MKEKSESSKSVDNLQSSKKSTKIGLLGGTFDPIHFGHLNLAIELKERCGLDQVWFIPAACSPFKEEGVVHSAAHRLRMLECAISDHSEFKIIDSELRRPPPSYTIDTLKNLILTFPHHSFSLLLGDDVATSFYLWKEACEIIKLLPIYVGKRQGSDIINRFETIPATEQIKKILINGLVEMPAMEIAAKIIRKRIQMKLYCKHLVPSKVLDYIYQNQLYFND